MTEPDMVDLIMVQVEVLQEIRSILQWMLVTTLVIAIISFYQAWKR